MKHLVVIDGLSFLFRAYHAVRPLTRADGLHTNALFGFAQMLTKVVRDLSPDLCVVALDSIGKTFRDGIYNQYKANRTEMDEEMAQQMPYFEPMIAAFGIRGLRVEGVEADDIIATIARRYGNDYKVTIVSSDKDLMQLIGGNVSMLDTMKGKIVGLEEVAEKFGVTPDKVVEVQALIGDSSDNVPGVYGVGPKTAAQLINAYGDLEGIYAHIEDIKQVKLKERLIEHKDTAFMSRELVRLKDDVDFDDSEFEFTPTPAAARDFLLSLEFNTLAGRLNNEAVEQKIKENQGEESAQPAAATAYETVTTAAQLQKWLEKVKAAKIFGIDTETDSLDAIVAKLVGISLAVGPGDACYIPLAHRGDMLSSPQQLKKEEVLAALKPILENTAYTKVAHNLKYDFIVFKNNGITIQGYDDTMLMSFCLAGGLHNHGLDGLCLMHLDHKNISYKEVCGTGAKQISFDQVPLDKATAYAAEDADMCLRLYTLFSEQLAKIDEVRTVYETIERPLVPVIAAMEMRGVAVDKQQLAHLSQEFAAQMAAHEQKIFALAGCTFNVNSPKQLGEVLFDKLGLPSGKKTQSGWSTNEETLNKLADAGHDIANEVLAYRSLAKLRSTYSEALVQQINPQTGRVHTSYNQVGAATGRFSSSDPNLQNIPIRTENGRRIRHAFVAKPGYTLMSADYSQIELRLLAHMADVESLKQAFAHNRDIHSHTAHQIFDVPIDEVTAEQRRAAKIINFGIVYGMGAFSLAKQLGVGNAVGKEYIDNYFTRYSGIRAFIEEQQAVAHKNGYVKTFFGRRVHLPSINDKNKGFVAQAERAAINAPLQGSNADIIKLAMKRIEDRLTGENMPAQMLMQVHDELVFEVRDDAREKIEKLVREEMENVVKLSVPLKVGIGFGDNWEDAH